MAIALRNRWRRQQVLSRCARRSPKNILMIGPPASARSRSRAGCAAGVHQGRRPFTGNDVGRASTIVRVAEAAIKQTREAEARRSAIVPPTPPSACSTLLPRHGVSFRHEAGRFGDAAGSVCCARAPSTTRRSRSVSLLAPQMEMAPPGMESSRASSGMFADGRRAAQPEGDGHEAMKTLTDEEASS